MVKLIYQPLKAEGGYYYYFVPGLTPGDIHEVDETEAERLLATGQFVRAPKPETTEADTEGSEPAPEPSRRRK